MSMTDCIYGPCGDCEYDEQQGGGICSMYTPKWSVSDVPDDEDGEDDDGQYDRY